MLWNAFSYLSDEQGPSSPSFTPAIRPISSDHGQDLTPEKFNFQFKQKLEMAH